MAAAPPGTSDIRVSAIVRTGMIGALLRLFGPAADRLLGVRRMRRLYERRGLAGLDRYAFLERFLEATGTRYRVEDAELEFIPRTGPVVILGNHPLGGLEGILLALLLRRVRPDYKLFVNIMLYYIVELRDFFIFTNPMFPGSRMNRRSIGQSRSWLRDGHCLLLFPAGRVGIYRPEKGCVTDEAWDRIGLSLGLMTGAAFVPLFVGGSASRLFSVLSRHIYPMKVFMLGWEFLKSFRQEVGFRVGRPIPARRLGAMSPRKANAWLRMRTYLLCPPGPELHPEVADYIRRYGLGEAERDELIATLEGRPDSQEALRRLAGVPQANR